MKGDNNTGIGCKYGKGSMVKDRWMNRESMQGESKTDGQMGRQKDGQIDSEVKVKAQTEGQ